MLTLRLFLALIGTEVLAEIASSQGRVGAHHFVAGRVEVVVINADRSGCVTCRGLHVRARGYDSHACAAHTSTHQKRNGSRVCHGKESDRVFWMTLPLLVPAAAAMTNPVSLVAPPIVQHLQPGCY